MDKLIDAVVLNLSKTGKFDSEALMTVRFVLNETLSNYEIKERKNELVEVDVLKPRGYEEFFADKIMCGTSPNTIKMYKYTVDKFLLKLHKPLERITGDDIAMYIYSKRVNENASERYSNNIRRFLSSFFSWLHTHEYIPKNPMLHVKAVKEPYRKGDTLTCEQFELLMKNAVRQRDRAILAVMGGSGLRRQELCDMLLKDLDLEHNKFIVIGKGNKERTCFLTSRAKMELKLYLAERKDDDSHVFVREWSPHKELTKTGLGAIIKRIGEDAGLEVHPHMLRHYFADCAHEADIDVVDIARMMGHASISTTQIYIANNVEDLAMKHHRLR